jgi:hypothetical protein
MKQFIMHLNDKKSADKKFILEDLDATHLLIKGEVRDEITRKVDEWMDEVRIKVSMLLSRILIATCLFIMYANVLLFPAPRMYFPILNELERTWTLHSLTS